MPRPSIEITKLAISYTHIRCIRVSIDDPGNNISGLMMLSHLISHPHQVCGGCIFEKENTLFSRQKLEIGGPLQEFRYLHPETSI
jgi:hypothetical protein